MNKGCEQVILLYSQHAERLAEKYKSYDRSRMFPFLDDVLSGNVHSILDVGAGNGIDAYRFATQGYCVTAVEPSDLILKGKQDYSHENIEWIRDTLPDLQQVGSEGQKYDLVLLNRVFMHIPPEYQTKALERLFELVSNHGSVYMISRHGPSSDGRTMFPVDLEKIQKVSEKNGFLYRLLDHAPDYEGRPGISWSTAIISRR